MRIAGVHHSGPLIEVTITEVYSLAHVERVMGVYEDPREALADGLKLVEAAYRALETGKVVVYED